MKKMFMCAMLVVFLLGFGNSPVFAAKDTLTVANIADIRVLDPLPSTDNVTANVLLQMFENLVFIAPDGTLKPMLAERWEQPNPTTHVFYIKKGVKFHNGEECTATDVKFTLDRALGPQGVTAHSLIKEVAKVEVVNKYTVKITMKSPVTPFLYALGESWAGIVNKKAVESGDPKTKPVGTGPFKFVSWRKSDRVVLERFDGYHGKKPNFKNLVIRAIPESSSRTIELQSGAVDVIYDVHFSDFKRIEGDKKFRLLRKPSNRIDYFEMNLTRSAFKDIRVCKAIKMALDIAGLQKAVWRGVGYPTVNSLPKGIKYSINNKVPVPAQDVEGAKKLLAEAGIKNLKLTLVTYEFKEYTDAATIVQSMLADVGITVDVKVMEMGAFYETLGKGDFDISTSAWGNNLPDPEYFFGRKLHSRAIGALNYSRYSNPKFDALLDKGRAVKDGPERGKIYAEAQQMVLRDLPIIPWSVSERIVGTSSKVKNFEMHPRGFYRLWMAELGN